MKIQYIRINGTNSKVSTSIGIFNLPNPNKCNSLRYRAELNKLFDVGKISSKDIRLHHLWAGKKTERKTVSLRTSQLTKISNVGQIQQIFKLMFD